MLISTALLCGRQTTTERLSRKNANVFMSLQTDEISANSSNQELVGLICKAFEAGMRRRSMAITSQGYIGAMPQEVQPGDLVCVLFGCSVPVVLRKRERMVCTVLLANAIYMALWMLRRLPFK